MTLLVKSNKTDAADAEAICEAVQRPGMRFAALKEVDVQAMLALHRTRRLLIKQRTQMINSLRGQCAEFGLVAPQTRVGVAPLIELVQDPEPACRRRPERWTGRSELIPIGAPGMTKERVAHRRTPTLP